MGRRGRARHVRIVLVILFSHLVHYPTLPYSTLPRYVLHTQVY